MQPKTLNPAQTKAKTDDPGDIRREQLRLAKRRQRQREKQHDLATYQLRLPQLLAGRLQAGRKEPEFVQTLEAFIHHQVLCIDDYENLKLLAWNRTGKFVTRREAFQLYEGNWRHVDRDAMAPEERKLIAQLTQEFGKGVINA